MFGLSRSHCLVSGLVGWLSLYFHLSVGVTKMFNQPFPYKDKFMLALAEAQETTLNPASSKEQLRTLLVKMIEMAEIDIRLQSHLTQQIQNYKEMVDAAASSSISFKEVEDALNQLLEEAD